MTHGYMECPRCKGLYPAYMVKEGQDCWTCQFLDAVEVKEREEGN